jgi:AAA15 family ATPase/GTPase
MILNASLLTAGPPIMVIGKNGIGKTEMLKSLCLPFKNTVFTTAIDYAGFKQYENLLKQKKIQNIVLSDLQSIVLRPPNVRGNLIRLISSLTAEGTQFELTYTKDTTNIQDFSKRKKNYNLNVIIGGTERHVKSLIREGYHDLLVRFVYLFVDRDPNGINFKQKFKMEISPKHNLNRKWYDMIERETSTINYGMPNARENMLMQKIQIGLRTVDFHPQGQIMFYRPYEGPSKSDKDFNLMSRLSGANL